MPIVGPYGVGWMGWIEPLTIKNYQLVVRWDIDKSGHWALGIGWEMNASLYSILIDPLRKVSTRRGLKKIPNVGCKCL